MDGTPAGTVLAVAPGAVHRGNLLKFVEQGQIVYVAAVEYAVDAFERVVDLRPERRARFGDMGVGDQADSRCHWGSVFRQPVGKWATLAQATH